jgi:hypothetical protein
MAINFLTTTNTLPEIQINDAGNNPRLELQESGSVSGGISTTGGALVFEASSGIEKARILSTGQFLIGHTSYYYAGTYLQVGNTSDNQNGLQITTSTSGDGYILFGDGTGASSYIGQIRYNHTDNFMRFNTSGSVAMTIDSSQRVGIGTLTPSATLHVKPLSGGNGEVNIERASGALINLQAQSSLGVIGTNSNHNLSFKTNSNVGMTLTTGGKVGIGTTSPGMMLHVKGGDEATMKLESTSGEPAIFWAPGGSSLKWENRASASRWQLYSYDEAEWVFNIYDAKIGIGTVSPSYKVDIAGDQMRLGDSNQTTTYFRMEATNTAGAPARAVGILQKGYESRAQGIFHEDTGKSNEEWFSGIPYGATFNNWQVGYDSSGGQPEYTANAILTAYHDKSVYLNAYGSGTYTGTAAKLLAITSSGKIIETSSGSDLPGGPYLPLTAGSGNKLTGDLYIEEANTPSIVITDTTNSLQGRIRVGNTAMYIDADAGEGVASTSMNFQVDAATKLQLTQTISRFSGQNVAIRRDDTVPVLNFDRNDTSIVAGNDLGQLQFKGSDPSSWNEGARISVEADGTWDTDVYPTRIKFEVKETNTLQTALKLEKDMDAVFGKDILLGDNQYLMLGNNPDLKIYHNGSHSFIQDTGAGDLRLLGSVVKIQNTSEVDWITCFSNTVELKNAGNVRLATTGTGVTVSGTRSIFAADTVVNSFSGTAGVEVYKNAGDSVLMVHQDDGNHESVLHFRTGGNDTKIIVPPSTNALQIDTETTTDALVLSMSGYLTLKDGIQATNTLFSGTMNIAGGIYHIGDTNTYFGFDEGNDTFRVVTGGGERLGINNSGVRIGGGARVTTILDEDDMASDSNTALATQQSIKAYVDTSITGSTSFRGAWDPDAGLNGGYGNPNLNTVTKQDGYYYICSDNGSATPNGTGTTPNSWHTGDWVVYNSNLGSSGEWQKIDNSSVISGAGTGGKIVKWSGSGTSETLTDSIIQDNGSGVGIGTAPAAGVELHVDGDVRVDSTNGVSTRMIRSSYFSSGSDIEVRSGSSGDIILGDGTARLTLASDDGATFAGNISLADSKELLFGAGNDLLIKHNGTNNVIQSVTGDLKIGVSNTFAVQNDTFDENMITATEDGKVELYYNGSKKFETTSGGATLTGAVTVSGGSENLLGNFVSTDSIAEIRIQDNSKYTRLLTVGTQFKIMPNDGSETLILDGNGDTATFAGDVTIGALTSGETAQLTVNNEGGVPSVARFKSRTNKAHIEISDNDTTGYVSSENNFFSLGRNAGVNANNINIDANNRVGIGTTTIQGNTKVNISGAMLQDGKTSWLDSSGTQLTTTGRVVAGLVGNSGGNGASALYMFTCYGGNGYQRIVYSIKNSGGTWIVEKDIDEGQNAFDVVASTPTSGSAVTFTFKARSTAQSFTASVWIEHIGSSIDTQYVG